VGKRGEKDLGDRWKGWRNKLRGNYPPTRGEETKLGSWGGSVGKGIEVGNKKRKRGGTGLKKQDDLEGGRGKVAGQGRDQ